MNPDPLTATLQKGFHTALGATTSLVESVQDSRKWDETMRKLTTDFDQLAQEWEAKGAVTEQEARSFVDAWLAQQGWTGAPGAGYKTVDTTVAVVPSANLEIEADLKALTAQVAALREELERLQNQKEG